MIDTMGTYYMLICNILTYINLCVSDFMQLRNKLLQLQYILMVKTATFW